MTGLNPAFAGCRLCGATHAKPRRDSIGKVCDTCWTVFTRSLADSDPITELEFNRWLTRQMMLAANRLKKFGFVARCEAATLGHLDRSYAHHHLANGHQCKHWATHKVKGRFLCQGHARSSRVTFVGTTQHSAYEVMKRALVSVAKSDKELAAMLISAAAELTAAR